MYIITESDKYRNLNSKTDLIYLIRKYTNNKYTFQELKAKEQTQLFCMFYDIENKLKKGL
jgi:hypothetical protein